MRDGQRIAVIGSAVAVVVAGVGLGVYALAGGGSEEDGDSAHKPMSAADERESGSPSAATGPPSAEEVEHTAQGFLDAWSGGNANRAASMTDEKSAANKALSAFRKDTKITKLTLTKGDPQGATVPFKVTAQVAHDNRPPSDWSYDSRLTVVRDSSTGEPRVDWQPALLHPKLKEGQSIRVGESKAPPVKALDRDGGELTAREHPTLRGVLSDLGKRYAEESGGSPGVEIQIVDAQGKPSATLLELTKGTAGTLQTTLDANLQRAAERAVAGKQKASVVAVKPSTGEILALANAPANGFNTALHGSYAPGSTMKIVSSAMLIDKGLAKADAAHPCPKYFTHGGWRFRNDDKFEIKGGTFAQSFARSCNTAFISQAPELTDDDLTKEARDVFGIGLNWQVGVSTFDGRVPVQSDAQMAASLIGQGGVRTSPLVMASVAATVRDGTFRQPYLVAPSVDNRSLAQAPRTMQPGTLEQLRGLMRLTATSGTAAEAMAGLSGDFGAKTGSAEVDGQEKPNAWFTGYRNDVAAAAVVPNSGHGGEFAGPVVKSVLAAG